MHVQAGNTSVSISHCFLLVSTHSASLATANSPFYHAKLVFLVFRFLLREYEHSRWRQAVTLRFHVDLAFVRISSPYQSWLAYKRESELDEEMDEKVMFLVRFVYAFYVLAFLSGHDFTSWLVFSLLLGILIDDAHTKYLFIYFVCSLDLCHSNLFGRAVARLQGQRNHVPVRLCLDRQPAAAPVEMQAKEGDVRSGGCEVCSGRM